VSEKQDAGDLGSILGVFAHPDDEAYLAGALMARAVDAGRRVSLVTATRGELGFPADDPRPIERRMAIRETELECCLEVLGVTEHVWLDYPDGGCADVPVEEPVARLLPILEEVQPDTVLTFGPDGGTYHADHIATGRWATLACRAAARPPSLLYAANTPEWLERFLSVIDAGDVMMSAEAPITTPIDELAVRFVADDGLVDRKLAALLCQASQTERIVQQAGVEEYRELLRAEYYRAPTADDWPA
jgi:LmbE family N-acetylglucosaminyl deacetylase